MKFPEILSYEKDSKFCGTIWNAIKGRIDCVEVYDMLNYQADKQSGSFKSILMYHSCWVGMGSPQMYEYAIESKTGKVYKTRHPDSSHTGGATITSCIERIIRHYVENKHSYPFYEFQTYTDFWCDWHSYMSKLLAQDGFSFSITTNTIGMPRLIETSDIIDRVKRYVDDSYLQYLSYIDERFFNEKNANNKDNKIKWDGNRYIVSNKMYECIGNILSPFFGNIGIKTDFHSSINNCLMGKGCHSKDEEYFRNFKDVSGIVPYRTSWNIFDEAYCIATQVDFVHQSDNDCIVYAWTNDSGIIDGGIPQKTSTSHCVTPLSHIPKCKYYAYALLLSFQKKILERNYGLQVSSLRLGVFNAKLYSKGYVLNMPFLSSEVDAILAERCDIVF